MAYEQEKLRLRGRSHAKQRSLLKAQIPIRTWIVWDDGAPGFVEMDLLRHKGSNSQGEFCFTLMVSDIATGWTVNRSVHNKAQKRSSRRSTHNQCVPLPIVGSDSDNGSEFIKNELYQSCHGWYPKPGAEPKPARNTPGPRPGTYAPSNTPPSGKGRPWP
ncbi:hypothetical protein [Arthrobacter sp. 2MCAF14]|uniref:hypothetical protein n=1 Tax=Arthrobacter sp. 2MCAF14 TaxID=3232982 RepID=UPI003F93A608